MAADLHNPVQLEICAGSVENLSLVANDNTTRPEQQLSASSAVYESNAPLIFDIASWFLPQSLVNDTILEIAHDLSTEVPSSGYQRYANLIALKITFLRVKERAKPPIDLGYDEAFCLFLRERYGFSCKEIGAIVGTSEGSIRTRLERARAKAFPKPLSKSSARETASALAAVSSDFLAESPSRASAAPDSGASLSVAGSNPTQHLCIRAREQIEDWNSTGARLGHFTAPPSAERAVGPCAKCDQVHRQRIAAHAYFQELPRMEMAEDLKKFPVSPLFVKEGKRLMFNWASAPWYVKALFEGLLATTLVLGVVLSIPRIKGLYEFWLERRLDLYSVAELAAGLGSANESGDGAASESANARATLAKNGDPLAQGSSNGVTATSATVGPIPLPPPVVDHVAIKAESEFVGRDAEIITSDRIYRILIKTDSPDTIKDHALRLLSTVKYVAYDKDSVGAELPGGVMFDLFVPIKDYKRVVAELTRLGESKVIITRAKERGMAGKARVKIWLQRI